MATLEKIRSKSVLLVVIIAVALLAFILGDAITNGRNLFGNNTTVAKVGNEKIEIQDYQKKQQELSAQLEEARRQNPEQYASYDSQVLSQQALEELINERLLNNAVSATGIQASPEILRFVMIESPQYMIPEMQRLLQSMQQSGLMVSTPAEAYAVIFTPQSYNLTEKQVEPFQRAWVALEGRYNELIGQMVYLNLLQSSFKANDLDIAATKRDYVAAAKVKVAKKPFGELSEKDYPVSDDEIKKAYEAQKEVYAIPEETKEISFIAVNVTPSSKDTEEATILATTVVEELKKGGVSKDTRKAGLDIQRHEMRLADINDPSLKTFLQTAPIDSVSVLRNNLRGFSIAKINSRNNQVDSIEISSIQVRGNQAVIENVLAYANSGMPLDSINKQFSADSVMYQTPQWVALYSANGAMPKNLGFTESVYDSLYNSNGSYIVLDQQEGVAVLGTVSKKSSPKEIVEYETVDYVLQPSDATLADAIQKLQKFVTDNNTAKKFAANAQKAGYNAVDLAVTPSTPAVPMGYGGFYPDSRSVVRWVVMDGKDGEVSKIYQSKDPASPNLYVAAVLDTYKDYVPWDNKNVKENLTAQVRREKAGKAMVDKYAKSNSVEAAAQAMGVEVVEVESLQGNKRDMTVTDSKVKGKIMGSKPSGKVYVVSGDDGVYAYVISGTNNETVGLTDENFANSFLQAHRIDPTQILRGKKKIENNIYKFEQAE